MLSVISGFTSPARSTLSRRARRSAAPRARLKSWVLSTMSSSSTPKVSDSEAANSSGMASGLRRRRGRLRLRHRLPRDLEPVVHGERADQLHHEHAAEDDRAEVVPELGE